MDTFPASIESCLKEAGFAGTEVIIIRKLLQEDGLTIRELAAKTGKSTGVLDQAVKKLIVKGVIERRSVNSRSKFFITSLQPILDLMERDTKSKQAMLQRRHDDFRTFVTSITVQESGPQMEYFEGLEGIMNVYWKLLQNASELLHYLPMQNKEEEDPLFDFRKDFTSARKKTEVFSRIIAPDVSLGRRFQSRDMFEFRKTFLVPKDRYPFFIEQVIGGGKIGYIDHEKKKACIIFFDHLAHYDSLFFEADWSSALLCRDIGFPPQQTLNIPSDT